MTRTGRCCICDKDGGTSYLGGPFPYLHKKCKDYAHRAIVWHSKYLATVWSIRPWVGEEKNEDNNFIVKEGIR